MNAAFEPIPISASDPAPPVAEPPPNTQLLAALGRLVRGLSALFWGLPLALVACVQTAKGDLLRPFGVVPPVVTTGLLLYGLILLGGFQKQERVWREAMEQARLLAIVNLCFSPFLYWWNKVPSEAFFNSIVQLMVVTGLLFLLVLNQVLRRLTAMLPDETLRIETRVFTNLNRGLLLFTLVVMTAYFVMTRLQPLPDLLGTLFTLLNRGGLWLMLFLVLLPVAMTMALLWKTKEVILTSVFGSES
jgi:hypothetical protein